MSKTIGVIGLGSIGMRHAKNLIKLGHEVYGADFTGSRVDELIKAGGSIASEESLASYDAMIIATPTSSHIEYMHKYNNTTPLFLEKPIGDRRFTKTDNVAMVGYNLRFHECVQQAKEWVAEGLLGQPLWGNFVCAQYNDKPAYLRDGVILNWSHEIDLALHLMGPAEVAASATRLTDGKDDLTDIVLVHENGCRSTIHLDYLTKPEVRQSIIVGDKGTIIMDLVGRQAWLRDARAGTVIDAFVAQDSWDSNYMDEMRAFIDRIDGQETVGATGEEGLRVLEICLKVREQAGLA